MSLVLIRFPNDHIEFFAELLEKEAPVTCKAIREALPICVTALHDIWSGRQIFAPLDSPARIPPENLSMFVVPGDIYYYERPAHLDRGRPYGRLELGEIGVVYGRDSQPWGPRGPKVVNLFATAKDNLTALAEIGERLLREGAKPVEILPA